jgi:outer membrane protein TolC
VEELAAMQGDTRGRVSELVAEYERTRHLHLLYRQTLLPQAEATVGSARAAYQVGGVDFMTYLDAIMTVYGYRSQVIRLDAEQGKALAELEMLIATPLVVLTPEPELTAPGGAP